MAYSLISHWDIAKWHRWPTKFTLLFMSPDVCRGLQKAYFNEVSYGCKCPTAWISNTEYFEKAIVTQLLQKVVAFFFTKPLLKRARRVQLQWEWWNTTREYGCKYK